jgi:hypothetical protein
LVCCERFEQLGVGRDVTAYFLRGSHRDVLVALSHFLTRAGLQGQDRDDSVGDERHDRGECEQQREADGDVPDSRTHPV